jgi:hypothetical protein
MDEQEAERGSSKHPADDTPACGIVRQHRKGPPVAITCPFGILVVKPVVDHSMCLIAGRIGEPECDLAHISFPVIADAV